MGLVQGTETAAGALGEVEEGIRRVMEGLYFEAEPGVEAEGGLPRVDLRPQERLRVLPTDPESADDNK